MVTTAEKLQQLADAPPAAPNGPAWGGSMGEFGREPNGVQANVEAVFRRRVDAPPLAEAPDGDADLLGKSRVQASHITAPEYATLTAERTRLTELLGVAGKKAADIEAALAAPELLAAPDFSERVARLHAERDIVQARRGEAETAIGRCETKMRQLRDATVKALRLSVGLTARLEREEIAERRGRIISRITATVSPLLDELLAVKREADRPQDLEAVATALAEERFAPTP